MSTNHLDILFRDRYFINAEKVNVHSYSNINRRFVEIDRRTIDNIKSVTAHPESEIKDTECVTIKFKDGMSGYYIGNPRKFDPKKIKHPTDDEIREAILQRVQLLCDTLIKWNNLAHCYQMAIELKIKGDKLIADGRKSLIDSCEPNDIDLTGL